MENNSWIIEEYISGFLFNCHKDISFYMRAIAATWALDYSKKTPLDNFVYIYVSMSVFFLYMRIFSYPLSVVYVQDVLLMSKFQLLS